MNGQVNLHQRQGHPSDFAWPLWPVVPLYPYGRRRTLRRELVPGTIWSFEQVQGILYVVVPIRMTVVRLEAGGLLVYAPVAPTPECLRLMQELVVQYGEVKYIILPTVSGIEHKVFVGPFARHFPTAQVYVAPHQWSYPVNLPLSWLGLPAKRTHVLPEDCAQTPFAREFTYAILGPIDLGLGPFEEVAFYHLRSHTLLVTDSVVSVPPTPPAIVEQEPYPLLFHAKDHVFDQVEDTEATRIKGWQRIALFAFYFRPSAMQVVALGQALQDAAKAPDRSRQAFFGLYPFVWQPNWQASFEALQGGGRLFVAPILQQLILNRASERTLAWVNQVAQWNFERIVPCHFEAAITAHPDQFRHAFAFLSPSLGSSPDSSASLSSTLSPADFEFLIELETGLKARKVLPPPS